jgi:hypothetical protein
MGMLLEMGFESCSEREDADLLFINTCAVREHAEDRVYGNLGILKKIKEERGRGFAEYIDDQSRANLGCTLIATFGTETAKSAVLTACRGYRSEDCPDGIDVDTAQYLSSLIPQERGFLWSLKEVIEGDSDKGRKPVAAFVREVSQYPGLVDPETPHGLVYAYFNRLLQSQVAEYDDALYEGFYHLCRAALR